MFSFVRVFFRLYVRTSLELGLAAEVVEVISGHFMDPGAVDHEVALLGAAVLAEEAGEGFLSRVQPKVVDGRLLGRGLLTADVAGKFPGRQEGE